nr:putative aim2 family protein [Quercus suber]
MDPETEMRRSFSERLIGNSEIGCFGGVRTTPFQLHHLPTSREKINLSSAADAKFLLPDTELPLLRRNPENTVSKMTTHSSKACCELPPIISEGYEPKGAYETIGKFSTYITGPPDAKKAIFFMYDIFGFQAPTLQGADILSSFGYKVVMPDLLEGSPAQLDWYLNTEAGDNKQKFGAFLGRIRDPQPHLENISTILAEVKQKYPAIESWGSIGYCWGGKLVALTSGPESSWKVGISSSPANVDPEDGKTVSIPFAMLASKDEPADAVKAFGEALTVPKHIETFESQVHGWMSTRADFEDPAVKSEYERGYQVAVDFFAKHW